MDYTNTTAVLLKLKASDSEEAYFTDFNQIISKNSREYYPVDGIEFDIPIITGALESKECRVLNLPLSQEFITQLASHTPFSKVEIDISEVVLGSDFNVLETRYLFNGLLFQCIPKISIGVVDLICRDWKYYTDIYAGMPCTEQCGWHVFGGLGCGAPVLMETQVVSSIENNVVTVTGPLNNTTTNLYNKGFIEYLGSRIQVKYHSSGLSFELSKYPPPTWIGRIVKIYAGCDRSITTCRSIHNNESRFLGLGFCMIDYNPLYEEA